MEIVIEIINNITGFISYFAPGYVFIACFNFTAYRQRESRVEYLIIKSISISYLLFVMSSGISKCINGSSLIAQAIAFGFALLGGLLLGRLYRTERVNQIMLFLFNREVTYNEFLFLWEQSRSRDCVVYLTLTMKENNNVYEGQLQRVFMYDGYTGIALSYYICRKNDMETISDYSDVDNASILVNYNDIERFEFEFITE